jgi:hypothetical protein
MKIRRALTVLALILTCLPAVSLRAQPVSVQQLQNTQQMQQQNPLSLLVPGGTAPELYPGENDDIGPQRILKLNPRPTPWEVFLDSQFFYTNNATFTDNPKTGSGVYVNTVEVAYSPAAFTLGQGSFAPSIGIISQWYNYGRDSLIPLGFDAQTAFVSGKYNLGNHMQVFGGLNYTRLLNIVYEETYREFLPNLGVQRSFPINGNMLLTLGDQIDFHFTYVPPVLGSPTDGNDRFDEAINLAFAWQLTHHLLVQSFYRLQYTYYRRDTLRNGSRSDYLNSLGITLAYYFDKYASIRAFVNYNADQTSDPLASHYHEYDEGPGASLDIKF